MRGTGHVAPAIVSITHDLALETAPAASLDLGRDHPERAEPRRR
jgi:hypothetical protein